MDFITMTKERFSVRQYSDQPVESEKIDRILTAARLAPTAHNNQPQRIFVMRTPEALATVDACTRGRFGAPLVLVLCYDKTTSWKRKDGYDSGEVDCGIVGTHILFAAFEQGLGSCWVAMFKAEELRDRLHLDASVIPIAVFPIGYPAADSTPFAFHFEKRPKEETIFFQ
ncbi:MAG: nitroreductase family protein [bacterium]